MPKVGMEPQRRAELIDATIREIGHRGTLDVTVGQIAKRAGVSPGLAHHYFGGKEDLILSAMRHVLRVYGQSTRDALRGVADPRERLRVIVISCCGAPNFQPEVIAAWLNFYVLAQTSDEARRLLSVYHRRLHSNLVHDMRPLIGARAEAAALRIGGLIDGLYLRGALTRENAPTERVTSQVLDALAHEIGGAA